MQWIKSKLAQWVLEGMESDLNQPIPVPAEESWNSSRQQAILRHNLKSLKSATAGLTISSANKVSRQTQVPDGDCSMSFRVWSAIGGKVIEFTRYDSNNDRLDHSVYLVSSDQDLSERISKIIMMESIK